MGKKGIIFNIQHYSLHDGPGIRTIVFLKGCPLRCRWCCNPESQNTFPELSYDKSRCLGKTVCGECSAVCGQDAVVFADDGRAAIKRDKCNNCMACVAECPSKAYKKEGAEYEAQEVLEIVAKDSVFYRNRNGGLTVSGGEPLMQGEFLLSLLRKAKKMRLTTALETCGHADYAVLQEAAGYLDTILFDIKSLNGGKHAAYTGMSNQRILANFEKLCRDFPQLSKHVRTPVIPGFNDSSDDLKAIENYLSGKPSIVYERLPYHRFGVGKYKTLGRKYQMEE